MLALPEMWIVTEFLFIRPKFIFAYQIPGEQGEETLTKQYVFYSRLAMEEFFPLLACRAQQHAEGNIRVEVSGDEVRLMDGTFFPIYGQIPFVGRVSPEGKGCIVTGGFPVSAVLSRKRLLGLWLLAVLGGSLFGVPLVLMAFFAAVWLAFSAGLIVVVNCCMVGRRKRLLKFIEQEMKE